MSSMKLNGAQILLECLRREGVEIIFGYPGGVVLPLYDKFPEFPEIRHVLVRHEQGAAHAADGYARASGKVGVCLGTSGPGATNLVTGIATAQLDSVPKDALQQETRAPHPDTIDLPGFRPTFEGHPRQLRMAAREIDAAQRPVILA